MKNFWQKLEKPIIGLAPMDGITDEPMRQIQCLIAKPSVLYTEFISVEGFTRNPKAFENTLFFQENERPIIVQLFGHTPELFYESILKVAKLKFDGIDINMGCPAKNVLEKGGGGALIGNYKLASNIIEKSIEAIKSLEYPVPLSIKTRIGKDKIITKEWVNFLCKFPISEITIHGRLLKQGNKGNVYWEEIQKGAKIAHRQKIVCLGNGGIRSILEVKEKAKLFDIDGVLIGQGALGNPWIFKENYRPTKDEILNTIIEHSKLVKNFYSPKKFVVVLKHFGWYPKNFPDCTKLKVELLKTRNHAQVLETIKRFRQI